MKRNGFRRLLAGILAAGLLAVPALAAEEPALQTPDPWAVEYLADSYAMGLVDDGYTSYLKDPVTAEQVEKLTAVVCWSCPSGRRTATPWWWTPPGAG